MHHAVRPAWSKMPHGLKGFHCAKVFVALEASRPAVNDLHTARALRSRQFSARSAAMSAIAIRSILKDLGFEQSSASYLLTDSKGAYAAARNPINTQLRHVNMRYHRVRQAIRDGHVRPHCVPSAAQIADICTKPLPAPQFERLRPLAQGYGTKPALPDDLRSMLRGETPCTVPLSTSSESASHIAPCAFTADPHAVEQNGGFAETLRRAYC